MAQKYFWIKVSPVFIKYSLSLFTLNIIMKRLITCTDDTWDKPGDKSPDGKPLDSNVCLLYNAIKESGEDGTPQLKATNSL